MFVVSIFNWIEIEFSVDAVVSVGCNASTLYDNFETHTALKTWTVHIWNTFACSQKMSRFFYTGMGSEIRRVIFWIYPFCGFCICQWVWYRYNSLYGLCWGNPLTSQRHKSALALLFCFDTYRYGKVLSLEPKVGPGQCNSVHSAMHIYRYVWSIYCWHPPRPCVSRHGRQKSTVDHTHALFGLRGYFGFECY